MDAADQKLLKRLVDRQIDPCKGVRFAVGMLRPFLLPAGVIGWFGGRYIEWLTGGLLTANAVSILLPVSVIIWLTTWLIPIRIRLHTERVCREHDWFLCPWCRYPLTDLPDSGRCPECGKRYERANSCQLYRNAYGPEPFPEVLRERDHKAWSEAISMQHDSEGDR